MKIKDMIDRYDEIMKKYWDCGNIPVYKVLLLLEMVFNDVIPDNDQYSPNEIAIWNACRDLYLKSKEDYFNNDEEFK